MLVFPKMKYYHIPSEYWLVLNFFSLKHYTVPSLFGEMIFKDANDSKNDVTLISWDAKNLTVY